MLLSELQLDQGIGVNYAHHFSASTKSDEIY